MISSNNKIPTRIAKVAVILLIVALMVIVVQLRYAHRANPNQKDSDFFKDLFINDLTPEYLGALMSVLIAYAVLFVFGNSIEKLLSGDKVNSVEQLKLAFEELQEDNKLNNRLLLESIDKLNHEIQIIQPRNINEQLEKARQNTDFWYFTGGTGTFTKTVTLPELELKASKTGKRIEVKLLIIDPTNVELCQMYADLRSSLRHRDSDSALWSVDYVRDQSYATIILAILLVANNQYLKIRIGLKNHFSLFRFDIASSLVLITKEDPREQAIMLEKNSNSYLSYKNDFEVIFDQSKEIEMDKRFGHLKKSDITEDKIDSILKDLLIGANVTNSNLSGILEIINEYKNPY